MCDDQTLDGPNDECTLKPPACPLKARGGRARCAGGSRPAVPGAPRAPVATPSTVLGRISHSRTEPRATHRPHARAFNRIEDDE